MTADTTLKKVGFASLIMMASVFASRIIGVVRESAIAWAGGASAGVDAYQVAFSLPEILNHLVASGFLSITFIPILAGYINQERESEGFRVLSLILNGFGLLLLALTAAAMTWTPFFIEILAPGIIGTPTFDGAVRMTRIILPAQFFFFCGGLFMAVQFTKEKFFIPALAPLIYNIGIICGGVFLYPLLGMEGFAWGVLAGAFFGNFLLQWMGARRLGFSYFFFFDLTHPDFKRYVLITLPFMVGLTVTFSTEILVKFFGSFMAEGSIAAMNFAIRIMFILVGLFGQAIGMASYPFMAKIAARGDMDELNRIINLTLKFIFLVIPFSVLFIVLRREIVMILFQRGQFGAAAAHMTAGVLPFFLAAAFAFSAQTIVARGYYALENTLFPAIVSTVFMLAGLPVIYLLMTHMGMNGIALGLSLSVTFSSWALFECWNRKSRNTGKGEVYLFFLKLLPLSIVLFGLLHYARLGLTSLITLPGPAGALAVCIATGLLFLAILPVAGLALRINEINTLFQKITRRFLPWQNRVKKA